MLDLKFKTLHLVSSFIGLESKRGVVDERVEEDKSLDTFEMTTNIGEPKMELVNRELLIFKHYKWMLKTSNVHCRGGKK
jgi:hypothetical protein